MKIWMKLLVASMPVGLTIGYQSTIIRYYSSKEQIQITFFLKITPQFVVFILKPK